MQCRLPLLILAVWWMKTVPSGYPQEHKYGSYWKQQLLFLTVAFLRNLGEFFSSFYKVEIICYRAAGAMLIVLLLVQHPALSSKVELTCANSGCC